MARSVELTPPPRRGAQDAPDSASSPHEEGIRAVNPSPAAQPPAKRVLRLSTRAQTPSQRRSLSWALVKEPPLATTLSSSLNPTMADKTPPATTTARTRQKKSRRVASEPMLSKLCTSRTATTSHRAREQQVNLSPLAASAGSCRTSRTFDFHRATKAALASSHTGPFSNPPHSQGIQCQVAPTSPSPAAAGAHLRLNKKTNNNNKKKKTRTPRKATSNIATHPHPPSLVKSMLGLAARAVKAFSTARGRRRSMLLSATAEERDKVFLTKRRSALEPEWTDDDAHDDGQEAEEKPRQSSRTKLSPKATVRVKKRTRVSNGTARSRLAREEAEADTVRSPLEAAPPRTPRIGSSTTSRRQKVGAITTSSSAKRHPSSSGGGASTFRASSSRKRVRVGGRPSLSGSISGKTILYPSSVLSSSAAILNRARPVSRSEALVGEYTARAILRSSVNGGGGANDLLSSSTRSTTSYHYYRPMTGEMGGGETEEEEEEEEWVEEARVDEFGAALPASGHDTQIRESETLTTVSYIAHLEQQQGARGRFHRSLAPSPISVRTVVRNPVHSRAVNSEGKQQQLPSTRNSSVLSLRDLSHCAVADGSQLLDEDGDEDEEDNSASSPLSAFVRQLANAAAAHSSSQDGDVEDFSAGSDGGGGGLDSPTPTSTTASDSEAAAGPFSSSSASRSRAFRLPEWLPFASAAAEWTRAQSSEDENGDEEAGQGADENPVPSPFEDASEDGSEAEEEGEGANSASMRYPPPLERGQPPRRPMAPLGPRPQVDSADLASARLIGARRLSRELATTASLAAVLKRSNSKGSGDGGYGSAPVSPTTFGDDGRPLHGSSSPPTETTHLAEFGSANATASGGRIGSDLSQETLRPSSPLSSRLPSLSPVSPFKFRFSSESPAAAAAEDAIDPSSTMKTMKTTPLPVPSRDLRHSYRELTRRSADFALPSSPPASHVSAAVMRETALEVFGRVPPAAAAATSPLSGADSNSKQQQALRRTIRPGDDANLGRTAAPGEAQKEKKTNGGAWEIYRDEIDDSYAKGDDGSPVSRTGAAETSETEAGVLAERTEASMLRKLAAMRSRGRGVDARTRSGTQQAAVAARSGNSAEEEAEVEGEKENVRGYFSA